MEKRKRAEFQNNIGSLCVTTVIGSEWKTKAVAATLFYQKERGRLDGHWSVTFSSEDCPLKKYKGHSLGSKIGCEPLSQEQPITKDLLLPVCRESNANRTSTTQRTASKGSVILADRKGRNRTVVEKVVSELLGNIDLRGSKILVENGKVVLPLLVCELLQRGVNFGHVDSGSSFRSVKIYGANICLVDIASYLTEKAQRSLRGKERKTFFPRLLSPPSSPSSRERQPRPSDFPEYNRNSTDIKEYLAGLDSFSFWPAALDFSFLEALALLRVVHRLRVRLLVIESKLATRTAPESIGKVHPAVSPLFVGEEIVFPTAVE